MTYIAKHPYSEIPRYAYFIQRDDTKAIKIGMSLDPIKRFVTLQNKYNTTRLRILGVLTTKVCNDRPLHKQFKHLHIKGEWFRPARELLSYIEQNTTLDLPELDMDTYYNELSRPPRLTCLYCGLTNRGSSTVARCPLTGRQGRFHKTCYDSLMIWVRLGWVTVWDLRS